MKIRKLLLIIIIILFFSMEGIAKTPKVVDLNITSIGLDHYLNLNRYVVNVSVNSPGHLTYMEEYYTVDGDSNPRFCCSGRYYDGELTGNVTENGTYYNASFEMLRPRSHSGKVYTVIKKIVLLNDSRIYESWKTNDITIVDDTDSGLHSDENGPEVNIEAHETREKMLSIDNPVKFEYTSIDSIYEINATGEGDASLRIEILKDAPSFTYLSTGVAYRYINIFTDNRKISKLSIRYKINNSWITNEDINQLGLFIWNSGEKRWIGLPTVITGKDNEYIYLESLYDNLSQDSFSRYSPFAIVGLGSNSRSISDEDNNINNKDNPNNLVTNSIANNSVTNNSATNSNNSMSLNNSTTNSNIDSNKPIKNVKGIEPILIMILLLLSYIIRKTN